jgi:hypothetical protein
VEIYSAKKPNFGQKKDPSIKRRVFQGMQQQTQQVKSCRCIPLKSSQKYFAKKLDKNRVSKYINKAPEEKRFTETRAEPRKKNSLKA